MARCCLERPFVHHQHSVGADAGELVNQGHRGAPIHSDLNLFGALHPVVIDFTTIEATLEHLQWCLENEVPCVIGTTGFSEAQEAVIAEAAKAIPRCVCAKL